MTTTTQQRPWLIQDGPGNKRKEKWTASGLAAGADLPTRVQLILALIALLTLFLFAGTILQLLDPAAGILDTGILSVLLFGLIAGLAAILGSLWLQELLWQPFKTFRKKFHSHFNQLTSWQQCILYFSVFFCLLYAALWALAMVL